VPNSRFTLSSCPFLNFKSCRDTNSTIIKIFLRHKLSVYRIASLQSTVQISYSNFERYPLKEDKKYATITNREEEETIANRDEEKPKVVLKRSWWVTVRTASAHLLPIAITVCLLVVNTRLHLKGLPLTPYEKYAIQAAAKLHVSKIIEVFGAHVLTKTRRSRLLHRSPPSHWTLYTTIYSRRG
jgi:hypothetical protein